MLSIRTLSQTVINTLRVETILAMEGLSFEAQAKAIPHVEQVHHAIKEVQGVGPLAEELIDVNEILDHRLDTEERMLVLPKHIVVGGLRYDEGGGLSVMDDEGSGRILHLSTRRGTSEERGDAYSALGLDAEGYPDFTDPAVLAQLRTHLDQAVASDPALLRRLSVACRLQGWSGKWKDVRSFLSRLLVRENSVNGFLDAVAYELFNTPYASRVEAPHSEILETLSYILSSDAQQQCWEQAVESGELGNPLKVLLDIYEHGSTQYSLAGQGMQCRWDTSRNAAVWVPDSCAEEHILSQVLKTLGVGEVRFFGAVGSETDPCHARFSVDGGATWSDPFPSYRKALEGLRATKPMDPKLMRQHMEKAARDYCESTLESYNSQINGEVYGVSVSVIDRETGLELVNHEDESWGHIGSDSAEEDLEGTMCRLALSLGQPH